MSRVPALFILVALCAEISFFERASKTALPFIALFVLIGLCLIFRAGWELSIVVALAVTTIFCSVAIVYSLFSPPPENGRIESEAIIADVRKFGWAQAVTLKTDSGTFVMKRQKNEVYRLGETLYVTGWIRNFTPKVSEKSSFREDLFWRVRGVSAEISASDVKRVSGIVTWRGRLHNAFSNFPPLLRGYLNAMWTGVRNTELQSKHSRWGTVHLLAISGFHTGIVAWGGSFIFAFIRSRRLRGVLISALLWSYIAFAGAPPSAMRAGMMFQTALLSGLIGRPVVAVNCVAVAAFCLLTYSPFLFWDVGFRLSVVAAFTITAITSQSFFRDKISDSERPLFRTFWRYCSISTAVYFGTYPIVASTFGGVPAAGIIINLFAVPFFLFIFPFISIVAISGIFIGVAESLLSSFESVSDFILFLIPWRIPWNLYLSVICVVFFMWIVLSSAKHRGSLNGG